MLRFLGVATLGFLMNQIIFYTLLSYSKLGIDISLAITLILVSGSTYLLSRFWAFKIVGND
jgi:putative flippase GtrA